MDKRQLKTPTDPPIRYKQVYDDPKDGVLICDRLAARGFRVGTPTRSHGKKVRDKLSAFQRSVGLPATGFLDAETWKVLNPGATLTATASKQVALQLPSPDERVVALQESMAATQFAMIWMPNDGRHQPSVGDVIVARNYVFGGQVAEVCPQGSVAVVIRNQDTGDLFVTLDVVRRGRVVRAGCKVWATGSPIKRVLGWWRAAVEAGRAA